MAKRDYIPKSDRDLKTWAQNLRSKIGAAGAGFGLSAAEITEVETNCANIVAGIDTLAAARQDYEQAASLKQTNQTGLVRALRQLAQRMKKSAGYTEAEGQDPGLVGDEQTVDVPNSKPVLKASKDPSGWRIDFNLQSYFDGLNIYRKKASETSFSFKARDNSSPYIDTDAIDNGSRYYAYFVIGDDEVGQRSDEVVISV